MCIPLFFYTQDNYPKKNLHILNDEYTGIKYFRSNF